VRRLSLWLAGPLCLLGALVVAWLFELSTERVLLLAPVIVVGTGAVVGLVLLWTKMALGSVRRSGSSRLGDLDRRPDDDVVEEPLRVGYAHPDAPVRR
jgi:hypothetical protein